MEQFDILDNFRRQIDNIDNEILILLKRRVQIAKKIAKYKNLNKIELIDLNREDQIMLSVKSKAISMALSEGFIRRIFESIIEECKICQKNFVDKENIRLSKLK